MTFASGPVSIGIDPGISGAIAFLPDGAAPWVEDMPTLAYSETGVTKRAVDGRALARLLEPFAIVGNARVFIERVQPMPSIPGPGGIRRSMGAASAFAFGMSYWGAASVVAALAIELHLVHPQTWKAHFKLRKDKEMARALAIRFYPAAPLGRKKDQGRAEALLIARYGLEKI